MKSHSSYVDRSSPRTRQDRGEDQGFGVPRASAPDQDINPEVAVLGGLAEHTERCDARQG
jgi:hypothetical protein